MEFFFAFLGTLAVAGSAVGWIKHQRNPHRMANTRLCACGHHKCYHKDSWSANGPCSQPNCHCKVFIAVQVRASTLALPGVRDNGRELEDL